MANNTEFTDVIPIIDRRTKLTVRKQKPIDLNRPRTINDVRHENFKAVVEKHGTAAVAKALGLESTTFISQMIGKTKWREVKENTVRATETAFGLPHGSLDVDHKQAQLETPAKGDDYAAPIDALLLGEVMQRVMTVCAEMGVSSTPARQAWLVTTVFADALDHGGKVRDNFIRQLVRAPV